MTLNDPNPRRGADYKTLDDRLPTVKLTPPERLSLRTLSVKLIDDPTNGITIDSIRKVSNAVFGPERTENYVRALYGEAVPNFADISRRENVRLIKAAWPYIPGDDEDAKADWVFRQIKPAFTEERWNAVVFPYILERVAEYKAAGGTLDRWPDVIARQEWRGDYAQIPAGEDGAISFLTRNVMAQDGMNDDGGAEFIIARVNGTGFYRLLIMVMGGAGRSTRIYMQYGEGDYTEHNAAFPAPMVDESAWRVEVRDSRVRVLLNDEEIWSSRDGDYSLEVATMNGYPSRGFKGEWAAS